MTHLKEDTFVLKTLAWMLLAKKGERLSSNASFTHWLFGLGVLYNDYLPAGFTLSV